MIKNLFSVLIFLFIFFFIFFIISIYISDKNRKKISFNRTNIFAKIENNLSDLPILKNDTHDVIEFNSEYDNDNNQIKRSFWDLFIKND
tara:strand:+ start:164 stop:430 length:267 start_codon:yes stop_codon:yes gene_type:complete